ncbi:12027_t:CDS:2, partial [Dentiscutata heterogama]
TGLTAALLNPRSKSLSFVSLYDAQRTFNNLRAFFNNSNNVNTNTFVTQQKTQMVLYFHTSLIEDFYTVILSTSSRYKYDGQYKTRLYQVGYMIFSRQLEPLGTDDFLNLDIISILNFNRQIFISLQNAGTQ